MWYRIVSSPAHSEGYWSLHGSPAWSGLCPSVHGSGADLELTSRCPGAAVIPSGRPLIGQINPVAVADGIGRPPIRPGSASMLMKPETMDSQLSAQGAKHDRLSLLPPGGPALPLSEGNVPVFNKTRSQFG